MKTAIPLLQFKKCIILFMVGIICSALAYAIYVINPIKTALENNLRMTPGSMLYSVWKKPPIDIYIKVFVFNITNPKEFLNGEEKLKVEEIGPYVYQEYLENQNVSFNENGTMSYMPKRKIFFVPEMSVGDPKDQYVQVPNVPLLGLSSTLRNAGFLVNFPFARLASMLDSKPILNITVYDYFWGYEDSLVRLASGIVPNFIDFRKFGLLDRMYDEGENIVTMNIRKNKNTTDEEGRYLSIEKYNGSPGLAHWGYLNEEGNTTHPENTICNRIQGTTEGIVFPPNPDKHAVFRIFRKCFCRPIPIEYKKDVVFEGGIPAYLYSLADSFLATPSQNPDNECYCRGKNKCLKKGLSDLTPCYYSVPVAVSLPHFLDADPSLLEDVDGLHPDPKKHRTAVILQPLFGIPLKVNSRLQINLVMDHTRYNPRIKVFNDKTIPLFWTDLDIPSIPNKYLLLIKLTVNIMPVVQTVLICLLGIAGATTIVLSLVGTLWIVKKEQEQVFQEELQRRDSTDLRIPLDYGQYATIRILPAIKKITSRTDLFS